MANIDPNLQAVLAQHQQHLQNIQQQQQREQQRFQQQQDDRKRDKWIAKRKSKVSICDGSGLRVVREWIRRIHKAHNKLPANVNADEYMKELMQDTASEDLSDTLDQIEQANQANPLNWQQVWSAIS